MRIELDGAALHAALSAAIYERNSPLPILACAMLDAEAGRVRVTTSDLEAYAVADVPAKVTTPGRICVNVDLLKAASRPGTLKLQRNEESSIVQALPQGGSKLRLGALPAEDFPTPDSAQWRTLEIDPMGMLIGLRVVAYAAAREGPRPFATTVLVGRNMIAATDGHRGAIYEFAYDGPELCIPAAQNGSLMPLLAEGAVLELATNPDGAHSMLRVTREHSSFVVRLVNTSWPDIRPLMSCPEQPEHWAIFDREKLLDGARQFLPFTARENIKTKTLSRAATLVISPDATAKLEAAENEENCSWAMGDFGGALRFSCSLEYLAQTLGAIGADKVRITLTEDANRIVLVPVCPGGEPPYVHVISGMRL